MKILFQRLFYAIFLINFAQWSGGGLPIEHSPWNTDQGSLMGCYLLVLFKIKSLVICFCKISHTKFPNNTI